MKRKLLGAAVASVLVLGAAALVPPVGAQDYEHGDGVGHELGDVLPMMFVHGGLGSGQQFEAQALRFASNGYPSEYIDINSHHHMVNPDGSPAGGHANPQCAPAALRPGTPAPPVAGSPGFTG